MATRFRVCFVDELPPGGRKIVEVEGRSIGVFNSNHRFYAVRNRCPHKGAPLCLGMVKALVVGDVYEFRTEREGEILKCPWHGWEFDLTTGASVFNPHRVRVKRYHVSIEPASPVYEFAECGADEDPSIETYPVTIEQGEEHEREAIYIHV